MTALRISAWTAGATTLASALCWALFCLSNARAASSWLFAELAAAFTFLALCSCARILRLVEVLERDQRRALRLVS